MNQCTFRKEKQKKNIYLVNECIMDVLNRITKSKYDLFHILWDFILICITQEIVHPSSVLKIAKLKIVTKVEAFDLV